MNRNRTPWMIAATILAVVATANTKPKLTKFKPLTRGEPAITVNPSIPGAFYSGGFDPANASIATNAYKKAALFDLPAPSVASGPGGSGTQVILPYPNYEPWYLNGIVASTGTLLIARAEGVDVQFVDYLPVVLMPTTNANPAMTLLSTYVADGSTRTNLDNSLSLGRRLVGVSRAGLTQTQTAHIQISASATVKVYSLPYYSGYNTTGSITALSTTYTPSNGVVDIDVTSSSQFVQTNTRTYFLAVDTSGSMTPIVFEVRG